MRWTEIQRRRSSATREHKVVEDERANLYHDVPVVSGPIMGIPIEEMDSLDTDSPLPEPQVRRLE
jgi:hypothetical protein